MGFLDTTVSYGFTVQQSFEAQLGVFIGGIGASSSQCQDWFWLLFLVRM